MRKTKTSRRPASRLTSKNVFSLVADFERENKALTDALKLFEVSNTEYQRALQALAPSTAITTATTHDAREERDSILE